MAGAERMQWCGTKRNVIFMALASCGFVNLTPDIALGFDLHVYAFRSIAVGSSTLAECPYKSRGEHTIIPPKGAFALFIILERDIAPLSV